MHLVGSTIEIYYDARSYKCQVLRKVGTKYGICNIVAVKYIVLNSLLLLSGLYNILNKTTYRFM